VDCHFPKFITIVTSISRAVLQGTITPFSRCKVVQIALPCMRIANFRLLEQNGKDGLMDASMKFRLCSIEEIRSPRIKG